MHIDTPINLEQLQALNKNTLGEALGIEYTAVTQNTVSARMPVDHRTKQPYGLLHGGASVALAETLGSVGSHLLVSAEGARAVGVEINANHLRSAVDGWVYGTATLLKGGRTVHVWNIEIKDQSGNVCCVSRLTCAIIRK